MRYEVLESVEACKNIWEEKISTNNFMDDWKACESFFDPENEQLHFIAAGDGLLPTILDKKENTLMLFGTPYQEQRTLPISKEELKLALTKLDHRLRLVDIPENEAVRLELQNKAVAHENNYYIDLEKTATFEELANNFSGKKRKNLRHDLAKLEHVAVEWNNQLDYEQFVEQHKQRFGEESDFADPTFTKQFEVLIRHLSEMGRLGVMHAIKNEEIVGQVITATYAKTMYVLNASYKQGINNLGKKMYKETIDHASKQPINKIDFLVGDDSGWKSNWNLQTNPVVTIEIEPRKAL